MNNIFLIISVFGFVISLNFFLKKRNKNISVLFLASFYLIYSIYTLQNYIIETGLISNYKWFYVWPLPIYSIISIPTYFYFVSTFKNGFKWKWTYLILFIPFFLSLIDVIIVYSKPAYVYDSIVELAIAKPSTRYIAKYGLLELDHHYLLRHLWQFFSLVALLPLLINFIRSNKQDKSKAVLIRWLSVFYVLLFLMSVLASVYGMERLLNVKLISFLQGGAVIIQIVFFIAIFLVAIIPISFPSILYGNRFNETEGFTVKKVNSKKLADNDQEEPKYGLDVDSIKNKLEHIENQELYTDPDFDLNKCAQELEIPTHHLSYFLNQNLNLSFSAYRNTLRIKKAKRLIVEGYLNLNTINALAVTCGFANRSSFSKIFKKSTGLSPGAYLQSIK